MRSGRRRRRRAPSARAAAATRASRRTRRGAEPGGRERRATCAKAARRLDVEQEVQHVAVLDDVLLAFGAHAPRLLGALLAAERHEVVEGDRLRADEAALEVGVD